MHHRARFVIALLVGLLAAALAPALPVAAQATTSDPYGPTVPPTAPPLDPSCSVDDLSVQVGSTVTGQVSGVEAGADVSIRLAGTEVAEVVADAEGAGDFSFTVPQLDDGTYPLVAVGATFSVSCTGADGTGLEVLGGGTGNTPPGGPGGAGTGNGSGSLAQTGADLLPFVAVALALLLVGAALRYRRRRAFA